ncbi:MAG: carboxypeptidase-like regulatory domain-containing protein, partial [Bacteroidales bacterium]|nr:carboxypeptidase-like regulatory domain-containing protein [Bacteroidales bacterium]
MKQTCKIILQLFKNKFAKIMLISFIILAFNIVQVLASLYSQTTKISISEENVTVGELFAMVENQTEFDIFFNNNEIDVNEKVSINVQDSRIEQILDQLFEDKEITYQIIDRHIVLTTTQDNTTPDVNTIIQQQEFITVTGKVTALETGEPLPGVSILIKGTTTGGITDIDGNYTINIPDKAAILVFSFIGYKTQEIQVAEQTTINVVLAEETEELDEVVVIGYGVVQKKDLTGAVTKVDEEALIKTPGANINEALQGKAAGVHVVANSGTPGAGVTVRIRGIGTTTNADPLYVI